MLHCSFLRSLTLAHLHGMEVYLPALACIRHQLRHVMMAKCLLLSSCGPGEGSNVFASGWDQLEELYLDKSSIDTHILAVNMPSLQRLMLKGFSIKDDAGEALYDSMDAFAIGCPRATYVEFEPMLELAPGFYKKFAALERLQLAFDPAYSWDVHVDWDNHMQVPSSLTALECVSSGAKFDADNWYVDANKCISLHAALSAAVACIRAGAPLQSLRMAHCTTIELMHEEDDSDDDEDGWHMVEPDDGEAVLLYRPLATALHGLVRLDLSCSVYCGEAAVNELVLSAPSLRSLLLRIHRPAGAHDRVLVCSGLQELHVSFEVCLPQTERAACKFTLFLEATATLRSCMLQVGDVGDDMHQGDSMSVVLGCHALAGIEGSIRFVVCDWLLGFEVQNPEGAEGLVQKQATITYAFDKDEYDWAYDMEIE
jgi:hypothetical protein